MRPKFIVDDMLGKLSRWLRIMGYDAVYEQLSDDELIDLAKREKRILLTRDVALARKFIVPTLLITSEDIDDQLKQVVERFSLDTEKLFTRCPVCNGELSPVEKEDVRGKVPEVVFAKYREFAQCKGCERSYWKGEHWDGIEERLRCIS